jgi:hypothetical protein
MKKVKSALLSLTMILVLGLVFQPTQVRAEESGGPQNTSNTQTNGGSSPTLGDLIRIALSLIW